MTSLVPNYPTLATGNCSSGSCSEELNFGDIFSSQALYQITKQDDLCTAYEKINANFKMLADGFLLLAKALDQRYQITFMDAKPATYNGTFLYLTSTQKLYVWHTGDNCYIPVYGCNSSNMPIEKAAVAFLGDNTIPTLQTLRNISDGVAVNHFTNTYGAMQVTFVDSISSSCPSGLLVFDKSDQTLKIWSPADLRYIPAYGCLSTTNPNDVAPTTTGPSTDKVEITN